MAQQTAVDFLVTMLIPSSTLPIKTINDFIAQAKQMEKEQIIEAFLVNYSQIVWETSNPENEAEEYYNEEYGE